MIFGTLKVIEPTGECYGDSSVWLCKCNCGKPDCPIYVKRPRRNITRKDWKPTCGTSRNHSNHHSEFYRFRNQTLQRNNKVGVAGVTKIGGKFLVRSMENGIRTKKVCNTLEEAVETRKKNESKKWGVINAKRSSEVSNQRR